MKSTARQADRDVAPVEPSSESRFVRHGTAIFATALLVRLVHIAAIRRAPFFTVLLGDSRAYDQWAQRIAGGDWIGREVFYQAPLYPYFLAVLYAIAGRHLLLVRTVQAIIGSAACVLLGLAARRLISNRAGLTAGLLLALYAPAIFFDALIQKSVLDGFFICLALSLIGRIGVRLKADPTANGRQHCRRVRLQPDPLRRTRLPAFAWLRRGSPERRARRRQPDPTLIWLALGLVVGALSLTRENAIVFTLVLAIWAFTYRARAAAAFLAGVAILIVPVAVRNSALGGGFSVTTSQFGPNFYIGNNEHADGTYQPLRVGRGAPEYERQDATEIAQRALGRTLTPADVSSYWTGRARQFIASSPGAWVRLLGRKLLLLVNRTEIVDTESEESHAEWSPLLRITSFVGHFGVLVPLAALGMMAAWPQRKESAVVYAMFGAYAASVVGFYVFARYRYPLVPFLVLFSAAGLTEGVNAAGKWRQRRAPWAFAGIAAVAVLSNWPLLSSALNRAATEQNLGAALQSDGRPADAMTHYRRAIELAPDYAPAYNNLASALRATGQLDGAIVTYQRALELRADFPDAHYNLANALLERGRADEAAEHLRIAMQAITPSADVHNNLGLALAAQGRPDEAAAEFRKALELEPQSVIAHRNLGNALVTAGVSSEGIGHLRRAAELAPRDASVQYDFGSALLEAGALDDAVQVLREAIRLAPDSAESHNNLGIALGSNGNLDEAVREFQQALKLKPGFADAQRNLAMARRKN